MRKIQNGHLNADSRIKKHEQTEKTTKSFFTFALYITTLINNSYESKT